MFSPQAKRSGLLPQERQLRRQPLVLCPACKRRVSRPGAPTAPLGHSTVAPRLGAPSLHIAHCTLHIVNTVSTAEQVLREFITLMQAEHAAPGQQKKCSALCKNLWFALQRHRAQLDWLLDRNCKKLRSRERILLWWALLECYALQGLPAPVATAVATGYARKRWGAQSVGFINGVLRNILREVPDAEAFHRLIAQEAPSDVACGLPKLLYTHWCREFGPDYTSALARILQQPAAITARLRGCFRGERYGRPYPAGGVMQTSGQDFPPEQYYMQDSSTLLAPFLLAPRPGEDIADLCAAPGGKSLIIAEMLNGTGSLFSADRSEKRLERLGENLAGYNNITIAVADAATPSPKLYAHFDAILLDVPCSNTGVIRRRPDARWNFSESKLAELVALQRTILEGAIKCLKPTGRIVYSTCSIEPDENIRQVEAFVAAHPEFTLVTARQLFPSTEHDGAFAAVLQRKPL